MTDAARVSTGGTAGDTDIPMSHRQVLEALSGLLVAMFVAILSGTIAANALPTIAAELHADETVYTWIITTTLLAVTVSTPLWGKLADLFNKKLLIQLSLVIFICGSMFAALTQNVGMLITARAVQGIGVGGPEASVGAELVVRGPASKPLVTAPSPIPAAMMAATAAMTNAARKRLMNKWA